MITDDELHVNDNEVRQMSQVLIYVAGQIRFYPKQDKQGSALFE